MNTSLVTTKGAEGTYRWLLDDKAKAFNEMILDGIRTEQKTLEVSKDPVDINRAQGAIKILKQIQGLRQEIMDFQNRVGKGVGHGV